MNYRLTNIHSELDWQLAYLAAQHAEAKPHLLTYDTPGGDVVMRAQRKGGFVKVEKLEQKL